jgi:peptidylprolyl isomerase
MTGVVAGAGSRAAVATGLVFAALLLGRAAAAKPVTVADLLADSPAGDWRVPDPEDTLYMDLERGRVVIELASRAAPQHVANIRTLARMHYFDGLAIVRVQDNYVVQWADPDHHRPVPAGVPWN